MEKEMDTGSRDAAAAALALAVTKDRITEGNLIEKLAEDGIKGAAANFGGEFSLSIKYIIERAVVAATREGLVNETRPEEAAVAGAAREAVSQIMSKANGFNVGGKIAVARYKENVAVAIFFNIGLLNLNEVAVGLGHRIIGWGEKNAN